VINKQKMERNNETRKQMSDETNKRNKLTIVRNKTSDQMSKTRKETTTNGNKQAM
jgi:hypothetical protein